MIEKFVCNALRTACIDWTNRDFYCFPKLQEMKKRLLERLWYPDYHTYGANIYAAESRV